MKTYNPTVIRRGIQHYANQPYLGTFSDGAKGRIIGAFDKALNDGNTPVAEVSKRRRLVLSWVCTPDNVCFPTVGISSKTLTGAEWLGLSRWYSQPGDNGLWYPRDAFATEARWVLNRATVDANLVVQMAHDELPLPSMLDLVERWISGQGVIPVKAWYDVAEKPVAVYQGSLVMDVVLEQDTTGMERYTVVTTKTTYKNLMPSATVQINCPLPDCADIEPGGIVQTALKFLAGEVLPGDRDPMTGTQQADEYLDAAPKNRILEPEPDNYAELCFP